MCLKIRYKQNLGYSDYILRFYSGDYSDKDYF